MGEVGCLGLDYDHLSSETMGILFELIRHSPHVLIAYRTISGNGLRIIVGYQRPGGCELFFVELHQAMLQKAMALFDSAGHQGRPAVRGLSTVVGTRPRRTSLLQLGCRTDSPHRQGTG